jgi:hypothetical protein
MGSPLFVPGSYAGTIYRYRGSRVATQFLSFAFVPLVPVRGSLHIADDEVVFLRRPFRLMPLSVVAAYLRVWPMLAVLLTVASGWGRWAWLAVWGSSLQLRHSAVRALYWAPGRRARIAITSMRCCAAKPTSRSVMRLR